MFKKLFLKNNYYSIFITILFFTITTILSGHSGKSKIIPDKLSVIAGAKINIAATGFKNTKKVSFTLKGLRTEHKLGSYSIANEDFKQSLTLPSDLSTGSYHLIAKGNKKSAQVILRITAVKTESSSKNRMSARHENMSAMTPDQVKTSDHQQMMMPGKPIDLKIDKPLWLSIIIAVFVFVNITIGVWFLRK